MIVILVGKSHGVFISLSFFDAAGNAGQVVRPFVEVPKIQIVLLLEDVLLHALDTKNRHEWIR